MTASSFWWHLLPVLAGFFFFSQLGASLWTVLSSSLVPGSVALFLWWRQARPLSTSDPPSTQQAATENDPRADFAGCEDNVRWSFMPSNGVFRTNMSKAVENETDFSINKFLVLHRPTHNQTLDASGEYRYGWHFLPAGQRKPRKRLWEVRCQMQWKRVPRGKIYFGLEMAAGQEACSGYVSKVKAVLLELVKAAIGDDFYQTAGDPATADVDELEPGCFVMPLWAVDSFHISNPGEEPEITGDLSNIQGTVRRTDGLKRYKEEVTKLAANIRTDKVYTFCFWGVSQFVDVNMYEFKGISSWMKMDASKLSGPPPLFVCCYEMQESRDGETRHLISLKDYFWKVALWSLRRPPDPEHLRRLQCVPEDSDDEVPVNRSRANSKEYPVGERSFGLNRVLKAMPRCARCEAEPPAGHRNGRRSDRDQGFLVRAGQKVFGGCMGRD